MDNLKIDSLESYKNFLKKSFDQKIKVLIHACCAPCSSEVLNELKQYGIFETLVDTKR